MNPLGYQCVFNPSPEIITCVIWQTIEQIKEQTVSNGSEIIYILAFFSQMWMNVKCWVEYAVKPSVKT